MTDFNIERGGRADRERSIRPSDDLGALGDREVPLAPVATSDVINKWLDGEMPEPANLRGDAARSVEFWRRIGEETAVRRQMVTPAHVPAQIMAEINRISPARSTETWYRREVKVSTAMLVGGALGLVALGVIIARILG
jgi:hypothetical protein